jgi:hypothetical protein
LASRFVSAGRGISRANRVGVEQACLAGKQVMVASAVAAGLPPGGKLRGVGKSGGRWGVRYNVRGYQTVVGTLKYTGAVHLVERDTRPHQIAPRRKKALRFADGGLRTQPVQHPGTKGKGFHERAEPVVIAQSERIIKAAVRSHIARQFT